MNLTQKISKFRKTLELVNNTRKGNAWCQDLLDEFNNLFPEKIFSSDLDYLRALTYIYCDHRVNRCPICSSRVQSQEKFLGCSNFPACKGARSLSGSPSLNDAMREYLAIKVREEEDKSKPPDVDRFRELDI